MNYTIDNGIKNFLIEKFRSVSDFDSLCRELQVTDIFTGNFDKKVTSLLKFIESNLHYSKVLLYLSILNLKENLKDKIDDLFNMPLLKIFVSFSTRERTSAMELLKITEIELIEKLFEVLKITEQDYKTQKKKYNNTINAILYILYEEKNIINTTKIKILNKIKPNNPYVKSLVTNILQKSGNSILICIPAFCNTKNDTEEYNKIFESCLKGFDVRLSFAILSSLSINRGTSKMLYELKKEYSKALHKAVRKSECNVIIILIGSKLKKKIKENDKIAFEYQFLCSYFKDISIYIFINNKFRKYEKSKDETCSMVYAFYRLIQDTKEYGCCKHFSTFNELHKLINNIKDIPIWTPSGDYYLEYYK